jgi:two-component system phosphate regulon sensor histidine kinase PhoR
MQAAPPFLQAWLGGPREAKHRQTVPTHISHIGPFQVYWRGDAMLLLNLRWLLFYILLALFAAVFLATWLARKRLAPAPGLGSSWTALERAPFALLVLQEPQRYRYANAQARRWLDLPASDGKLPQAEWAPLLERDRETLAEGAVSSRRYSNVPLSSGQVVRWWITPWQDLDVVLMLDVTAQRHAEQAAGRMFSDLSHELRTPLATILTHLEVLLLDDLSPPVRERSLGLLKTETQRMARLINDMLELGRLEASPNVEQRPVDLLALTEQAVAQVVSQAQDAQIALSLQADAPLPLVLGDPDRLRQVLLNLLDNAIKYCRPGDRVQIALHQDKEALCCTIADTGPGILAEHLPHVTRRFYRAAPARVEGSGLGLTLVQEILRRHDSQLEIESQTAGERTGTRVSFCLPTTLDRTGGRP